MSNSCTCSWPEYNFIRIVAVVCLGVDHMSDSDFKSLNENENLKSFVTKNPYKHVYHASVGQASMK